MSKIDEIFDKIEKVTERSGKLLIKVLGMLSALAVAVIMGYIQFKDYMYGESTENKEKKDSVIVV